MMNKLIKKNISLTLSQKIILAITSVLILTYLILGTITFITARKELDKTSQTTLSNGVDMVLEVIKMKQKGVANGNITLKEAQDDIKVFILDEMLEDGSRPGNDNVDLGEHGYLFIMAKDGTMIAHPKLEGTNQWDSKDMSDKESFITRSIIEKGVAGGGYSYYFWEHPYTNSIEKKIAYSRYDPEWQWIVASSIYMSDYNKGANQVIDVLIISLLVTVFLGFYMIRKFTNYITKPIITIASEMDSFIQSDGLIQYNEIIINSNDELGTLANSFNYMARQLREEINERVATEEELQAMNEQLESLVEKRTEILSETLMVVEKQNLDLEDSFGQLNIAKDQLIKSEKLAALGELVAGVAHEINTPLGNSITIASYIESLLEQCNSEELNEETKETVKEITDGIEMLNLNLIKAAELIRNFKEVAVDQQSQIKSKFNLKEYINKILTSLQHNFKNKSYEIDLRCDPTLEIISYPGALSQIVTNLIMNSLIHGFEGRETGKIIIDIHHHNDILIIDYYDDGNGINPENLKKIFNPFFTTKRHEGGSGLGMFILYNIVTQTLKGLVEVNSTEGNGVHFDIRIPTGDKEVTDFILY